MEEISNFSRLFPANAALVRGKRQMSYRQLDHSANQFAAYLWQLGVRPGDAVALCMERSFDWIVAALGILRTGAAYVPLDVSWPDARICYAVKDSAATALVARHELVLRFNENEGAGLGRTVLSIDPTRDAHRIIAAAAIKPHLASPDDLAYIIYTSGSAGVPKGVEITHANLHHVLKWHRDTWNVTGQDRVSHLLGLGFDAAVLEIWGHLSAGATLCLADEEVRSSAELMQQWMVREQITIALVPAVHGSKLMAMDWPSSTALRLLICGGEALRRGPERALPFQVVNHYGPTECTIVSTCSVLATGAGGVPAIGRPIPGASVYLLDESGKPVRDGEVGEMYIAGPGVGRGYRNLPRLTDKCFLPDPFSLETGRMYRSGDQGRLRPDGELEFCGRLDRQIKIRGFRVEPEEVSATLNGYPGVEFAIVVARPLAQTNQLIAYVLPADDDSELTSDELQQFLLLTLPEYMVPAVFIRLHTLPLTANGKIDLARLPHPDKGSRLTKKIGGNEAGSAISQTEKKLLALVREILDDDAISAGDNFFLAGGHSLTGAQLVSRLNSDLDVALTLADLFAAPSVQQLARLINTASDQRCIAHIWAELLQLPDVGLDDDFFKLGGQAELLSSIQRRIADQLGVELPINKMLECLTVREQAELLKTGSGCPPVMPPGVLALQPGGDRIPIFWIHYFSIRLARSVDAAQPFLVVRLMAEEIPSLGPSPTLRQIAARHVEKIVAAQPSGPYILGGLCLGGILAYEIAQQLRATGREVALLIMLDTPSSMEMLSPGHMKSRLNEVLYLCRRAMRFGPRETWTRLRARARQFLAPAASTRTSRNEIDLVQEVIATAASSYRPARYDGEVLLLLASERPPHVDFLSGWQQLLGRRLQAQYVDGHHTDLTNGRSVPLVLRAIDAHPAMKSVILSSV